MFSMLAWMLFIIATLLFALFAAAILRFLVFRFFGVLGLGSVPFWAWVIIIVFILTALQLAGVHLNEYYARLFDWISEQLKAGVSI